MVYGRPPTKKSDYKLSKTQRELKKLRSDGGSGSPSYRPTSPSYYPTSPPPSAPTGKNRSRSANRLLKLGVRTKRQQKSLENTLKGPKKRSKRLNPQTKHEYIIVLYVKRESFSIPEPEASSPGLLYGRTPPASPGLLYGRTPPGFEGVDVSTVLQQHRFTHLQQHRMTIFIEMNDSQTEFSIRENISMEKLFIKFAQREELNYKLLEFKFRGKKVKKTDTPKSLKLSENDVISCVEIE